MTYGESSVCRADYRSHLGRVLAQPAMAPTQSCLLLSAQLCGLTFYPTPQEHLTSQLILTAMITRIKDGSLRTFFS